MHFLVYSAVIALVSYKDTNLHGDVIQLSVSLQNNDKALAVISFGVLSGPSGSSESPVAFIFTPVTHLYSRGFRERRRIKEDPYYRRGFLFIRSI